MTAHDGDYLTHLAWEYPAGEAGGHDWRKTFGLCLNLLSLQQRYDPNKEMDNIFFEVLKTLGPISQTCCHNCDMT